MSTRRRIHIEDETLSGSNGSPNLTSDLPSRNGRRKPRSRLIFPLLIIIAAGVLGFLIPTLTNKPDNLSDSQDQAKDQELQTIIDRQNNSQPPPPEPQYIEKTFVIVETNELGYLNVRQQPATSGAKLGTVEIGEKLELLAEQTGWVKVKLNEPLNGATEGWVSSDYVEKVTEQVQVPGA